MMKTSPSTFSNIRSSIDTALSIDKGRPSAANLSTGDREIPLATIGGKRLGIALPGRSRATRTEKARRGVYHQGRAPLSRRDAIPTSSRSRLA